MTSHIAICRSGKTRRGFRLTAPKRHAAMAHLNSYRERCFGFAIYARHVVPVRRAVRARISRTAKTVSWRCGVLSFGSTLTKPARIEFRGAYVVPHAFLPGHARFQACKQSLRRVAHAFHHLTSFAASAFHEQKTTGGRSCVTANGSDPTPSRTVT